jgi:hypothetical protein
MQGIGNKALRWAAAIVVACALVLQSLTVAFAFSDGAAGVRLDRFGNPICNGVLNHGNDGPGNSRHGRLPPCCTFGCSMFAPFPAGPSGSVSAGAPWMAVHRILFPMRPRIYIRAAAHDPGNPRAPPAI